MRERNEHKTRQLRTRLRKYSIRAAASTAIALTLLAGLASCAPAWLLGQSNPNGGVSPSIPQIGEQEPRSTTASEAEAPDPVGESDNPGSRSTESDLGKSQGAESSSSQESTGESTSQESAKPTRKRVYAPLSWNIGSSYIVGRQGTTALWGACGECCIANTLNMVLGTAYSEADIVNYVCERGWCDPSTGGMTLNNVADTYVSLLPLDTMGAYGYGGDYAPSIDVMAKLLEKGIILNTAVYGEMMREGGHTGEGDVYATHWIVLHSVDRNPDGSIAGFGIIDSASSITYLSAQQLSDIYYGHDGTNILDPSCVLVYGWKYADE